MPSAVDRPAYRRVEGPERGCRQGRAWLTRGLKAALALEPCLTCSTFRQQERSFNLGTVQALEGSQVDRTQVRKATSAVVSQPAFVILQPDSEAHHVHVLYGREQAALAGECKSKRSQCSSGNHARRAVHVRAAAWAGQQVSRQATSQYQPDFS